MSSVPRVSVQVMVYNSERYLDKCLSSLRRQTYSDFEVLMIDAGSTDRSRQICEAMAQEDPRFIYISRPHCHVSEARQDAVQRSRGEFIAILDSDDWSYPDRLALQVTWMDLHPDMALLAGYYRVVNQSGFPLRIKPIHFTEDIEIRWRLTFGNCLTHSTVMMRKTAVEKAGGYRPTIRAGEDIELYGRLLKHGRFGVIPSKLSVSRVHRSSLSRTEPRDWEKDFIASVQQSITLQLGIEPSLAVAEALYNQSFRPADRPEDFRAGLQLIRQAHSYYRNHQARLPLERKLLGRAVFLHLLQFMTKNEPMPWWHDVDCEWLDTTRALCAVPDEYDWRQDKGLLFQAKHILKTSWRAIWLLCVR